MRIGSHYLPSVFGLLLYGKKSALEAKVVLGSPEEMR